MRRESKEEIEPLEKDKKIADDYSRKIQRTASNMPVLNCYNEGEVREE